MSAARLEGTGLKAGYYSFDADGKMIIPVVDEPETPVVKHGADADGYFYINGVRQNAYQLVKDDNGNYYFIGDYNKYIVSKSQYLSAARLEGTGLKAGYYNFDANGKMILN